MKSLPKISMMGTSIVFSFIYLITYSILSFFSNSLSVMLAFFMGSPFVVLWVVYSILNDKHQPDKTFDKYYYQNRETW